MSHLIPILGDVENTFGCPSWEIDAVPFRNSAVLFWSQFAEEVQQAFPNQPKASFQMVSGLRLKRSLLAPERELEQMLENLKTAQLQEEWDDVIQDLELDGSPNPVRVQIIDGAILSEFTLDGIDSEAFSFLLAWLLEWSHLPEEFWNDERIEKSFKAKDSRRNLAYEFDYCLQQDEIHEGLYQCTLELKSTVGKF
jgi:hypothetical protein